MQTNNGRWHPLLDPFNHLRHSWYWYVLHVMMLVTMLCYYRLRWDSFAKFVKAVDHSSGFMLDFGIYYAMSKQILAMPAPVAGYYYTSFFALVLTPLSTLQFSSALAVWKTLQFACVAAMLFISARLLSLSPLAIVLYVSLCVTSFPMLHCYRWGQISLLMTVCIMGAFLASNRNRRVLAGMLIAFAAAIKLYPALFIFYFVLKRDGRTCAAFGLTAILLYFVFPAAVLGFSSWHAFERSTLKAISEAQWVALNINSQYVVHAGLRWFAIIFHRLGGSATAGVLTFLSYAIALTSLVMVWVFQRSVTGEKHSLSLVTLFLSIPFVIKTSWPHYFVYLPLCQAAVLSYYASSFRALDRWGMVLAGLALASMVLSSVFVFNLFPSWVLYSKYAMLLLADALLLIALYPAVAREAEGPAIRQGFSLRPLSAART